MTDVEIRLYDREDGKFAKEVRVDGRPGEELSNERFMELVEESKAFRSAMALLQHLDNNATKPEPEPESEPESEPSD